MFCEISKEIVMEEKKNYINKLNLKLIDDDAETGGVSFQGETLLDFLQGYERSIDSYTDKEVNEALIECGILPLHDESYIQQRNSSYGNVRVRRNNTISPKRIK